MNDRIYYSREAEMRVNRERTIAVLIFMGLGLGIGAVLALMFAPKSGEKTRAELASTLEDTFENGRETTTRAVSRLEKEFGDLRKKVEDRLEQR